MSTTAKLDRKQLNRSPLAHSSIKPPLSFSLLFNILFSTILTIIFSCYSAYALAGPLSHSLPVPEPIGSPKIKTIAITQIVEHPALEAVRLGLKESLKEKGYIEGKNLRIIYENAQGNMALASQITNKLLSEPLEVGIAISTPSAQSLFYAAKRAHKKIPIVFTAVSDPVAAKLMPGQDQYPITGITDTPDLPGLMEAIDALIPHLKVLGVMYNPSETNSVSMVKQLKSILKQRGIQLREVTVNNTNDVASATQSLVGKAEALYFPQDNTIVSAIESVVKVANQSSPALPVILPIFTNDPVLVEKGVLAAVGYDYHDIGRETGFLVAQILEGKKANEIPIQNPKHLKSVINRELAKKMGLAIPKKLKNSTVELK